MKKRSRYQKRWLGRLGFVNPYFLNTMKNPLTQLALVAGAMAVAITTLVGYSDFRGFIDIQVGPQGGRFTIDNRQLVNGAQPPTLQASKKK